MAALEAGRDVALANKEALVSAGELMTAAARASGATILPVDSEHNAIFQCLAGGRIDQVRRIILTASGGPFRTMSAADMARVSPAQAVAHPNRSEEHTSELQSLMRISYAVFCLKKKNTNKTI